MYNDRVLPKLLNILKDPVVAALLSLSITLFAIYQASGGQNAGSPYIRDLANVFQVLLVVLVCYMVIRPRLMRSISKSKTTSGKVTKSIFGIMGAILLAAVIIVVLFALVFGLAFSHG